MPRAQQDRKRLHRGKKDQNSKNTLTHHHNRKNQRATQLKSRSMQYNRAQRLLIK